jgi:hypothetical protein
LFYTFCCVVLNLELLTFPLIFLSIITHHLREIGVLGAAAPRGGGSGRTVVRFEFASQTLDN